MTTTRYVKIMDEEDSTAADAIAAILGTWRGETAAGTLWAALTKDPLH